jgi:hypothetical protein
MNYINFYLTLDKFKCVYNNINIKEIKNKIYCIIFDIYGVKLYEGYIKKGLPNGNGILYENNKIIYIGNFINGKIKNNKTFFDINEKKCNKKYYKYDSNLIKKSIIEDIKTYIYVKQIDIYKKNIRFNFIKHKLSFFNYNIKNNKPLKTLYYFIKELKNEINLLDLKLIFLFVYNINNNNINININNNNNEILIKFIKKSFYDFIIYIKKLKKKIKKEETIEYKDNIVNDELIIIFNYINNLCLKYSKNKNNNINLININLKLYKYKCKKEYHILLDKLILKNNIKINSDDLINIFFIKIKNINNIININKKYNNNSSSNSINSNISNHSNIELDDIYLTAKIKNLFIIEKNDILKYNKFMLSIYKKLIYKIKTKHNVTQTKHNINKTKNNVNKNIIIKSNSCKDIILKYNNVNTLQKINNIINNNVKYNKLNIFEKHKKIKKQMIKLFKRNLYDMRLIIENNNGKLLDEDWIYYLSLMYKYLPIPIKKRIYKKTISTQTNNIYNNNNNIIKIKKLLKKNIIEKTYI